MKTLCELTTTILAEAGSMLSVDTASDEQIVRERVKHEGESFLTITFPGLCSEFERALDIGLVAKEAFLSYRKHGRLPRFLLGFWSLVFDAKTGELLLNPSIEAIFLLRQILLLHKKVRLVCTQERIDRAFAKYMECEQEVTLADARRSSFHTAEFRRVAAKLWSAEFQWMDTFVRSPANLVPRHGPGATADRVKGNRKYDQLSWNERLEQSFPSADFLIPNASFWGELNQVNFLEPAAEEPVRVISVAKTLKTPRIIAIEPTCMQYVQQALLSMFVERLERGDPSIENFRSTGGRAPRWIPVKSIGFTDQEPNRKMALSGSKDGKLATIDLSEASDRVSNQLVELLFERFPALSQALQASRSTRADVPGYKGYKTLAKFASMGSATCFPIEAMVFLTIIAIVVDRRLVFRRCDGPLTRYLNDNVRVYGDDIVVPTDIAEDVARELEVYGLKVNDRKSFWTGRFRESCGKDYYDGEDVTVSYCRSMIPGGTQDASEVISFVSLRNQLYKAGFWQTCGLMDDTIRGFMPLPVVLETSPVVGRHSFLGYKAQRRSKYLHSPIVKGYVQVSHLPAIPLDGSGALLKFFLKTGMDPIQGEHLKHSGRPAAVSIQLRWASAV